MLVVVFCTCAVFAQSVEEKTTERIGIISAMENEINLLLMNTDVERVDHIGGLDFIVGRLSGEDVVIVRAGIGKVYASAGTAALINNYNISEIIFTGIAGGVGDQTNVLDVVVASDLVQHDYGTVTDDGFYWRDEYNPEDKGRIYCDLNLVEQAYRAACRTCPCPRR